jgi:hypothetical protein
MIWDHLMDVAILVSFRLRMSDHNDQSWFTHLDVFLVSMIESNIDGELYDWAFVS